MEVVKRLWHRLAGWEYFWLGLLVLATLIMHFSIINQPSEVMFDEQYYVNDARAILDGHGELRREHPPVGELIVAFGMLLFGDNAFGWRFFSVIFGAAAIVFFYLICARLGMSKRASLLATFLLTLDNLSFVQASIAMLDVYSVTFMLAAFWLYLKKNYPLAGVAICFSTLAKLSGALALPAIALHWLLARRDRPVHFSLSMVLAPLLFFQLIPLFDFAITRHFVNPVSRIKEILSASGSVTFSYATHPYSSRPWEWVLFPEIMPYWWEPQYVAAITFTIWALIIPTIIYLGFLAKKGNQAGLFSVSWFVSTYLVWIPLSLLTDRMSYIYYFYPTVGAICIGIGLGRSMLVDFWQTRRTGKLRRTAIIATSIYLALHVAIFIVLSPLFSLWLPLYRLITITSN